MGTNLVKSKPEILLEALAKRKDARMATQTGQHTPTPWSWTDETPSNYLINGPDTPIGEIGVAANTAFIVQVVNSYEAMREALEEARTAIRTWQPVRAYGAALDAAAHSIEAALGLADGGA